MSIIAVKSFKAFIVFENPGLTYGGAPVTRGRTGAPSGPETATHWTEHTRKYEHLGRGEIFSKEQSSLIIRADHFNKRVNLEQF